MTDGIYTRGQRACFHFVLLSNIQTHTHTIRLFQELFDNELPQLTQLNETGGFLCDFRINI